VLRDAPEVVEIAVVGRPDPARGAVPVAAIVAAPGGIGCEELVRRCAARPARFKWPREFVRMDALPRTALGKVDVVALRTAVAGQLSSRRV
jgi:fatty-acyl-CoA synthase